VNVDAEAVVPPDDVAKDLVVSAVVRRVDDPLVLPGAPGMGSRPPERDLERVRELVQLSASLAHHLRGLCKVLAPARPHFDLRGDQLADQVLFELRALGGFLKILEAVRELERLGIEDGELLLDRHGEVRRRLELLAREGDLVLRAQALRVPHGGNLEDWWEIWPPSGALQTKPGCAAGRGA
jgi:hypothetical protein